MAVLVNQGREAPVWSCYVGRGRSSLKAAKYGSEAFAGEGEITEGPDYSSRLLIKNSSD